MPARDLALLTEAAQAAGEIALRYWRKRPETWDKPGGAGPVTEADQQQHTGLRLLPGRFMVIRQAMGLPQGRGEAAAQYLRAFVEEMKASGFVADAMARHGIQGASVAPAGDA